MPSTPPVPLLSTLRDSFLLEDVSRRIANRSSEKQRRIRELYDAASIRASIASELLDARQHGAAFALLKEAAALYLTALAIVHEPSEDSAIEGALRVEEIDDLLARGVLPLSEMPRELSEVQSWLADPDPLRFDRLSHDEALASRASLDRVLEHLRKRIEPRTSKEVKLIRRLRVGAIGIVLVVVLAIGAKAAFAPKNLALGKPVVASSRHAQSTAGPNDLTDGKTSGAYGVHTQAEDNAWVMIDLLGSQKLGTIKVFNRGDGYFDEGLPFALELSDDGKAFTEVDKRTKPFSRLRPWTYDTNGHQARYIRVRKIGRGYVSLSEIEVYGAR